VSDNNNANSHGGVNENYVSTDYAAANYRSDISSGQENIPAGARVRVCSKCGTENSNSRKNCENCGEKLGALISNEEAESLSNEIKLRNGEGQGLTRVQIRKRLTAGCILSGIGLALTAAAALLTYSTLSDAEKTGTLFTLGVIATMLISGLLVLNLIASASPKTAVELGGFLRMLKHPLGSIVINRMTEDEDIPDYEVEENFSQMCLIFPIISILISVCQIVYLVFTVGSELIGIA